MTASTDARTHPAEPAPETEPAPVLEPRQRWRLTFARDRPAPDEIPTGRDYIGRWETSLLDSGLPILLLASGRPRVALGAPLPSGCSAEAELVEFWLTDVRPVWQVREAVDVVLPAGHRARGLENVWLGAPALSGQVAAADYAVGARVGDVSLEMIRQAAVDLLARTGIVRERQKGGETKTYDLRPLLLTLDAAASEDSRVHLRMRTRIHPELGTGRPDEVIAALGTALGQDIAIDEIVRERLLLADDLD
ncbi:MAG TPA: DUF2344 domain-containing protein [Candidatus Limnocylindrales bacterium]|nr:DUF2344 domain-containing protein [Candidatus Limnocylindrales bacterium]